MSLYDEPKIGDLFLRHNILFQIIQIYDSEKTKYPYSGVSLSFCNSAVFAFNKQEVIKGKVAIDESFKTVQETKT